MAKNPELERCRQRVVVTAMMRDFFYTLPRNILRSFWGRNLLCHLLAIGATLLIVNSGFDWMYFKATRLLLSISFQLSS
jgi:hypothetical protein